MASNKNSFLLYTDLIDVVEKLPDETAGKLFKHILRYVNDLEPVSDDLIVELVFAPVKQSLLRDLAKYKRIVERNRANGLKGGRPKTEIDVIDVSEKTHSDILGTETNPNKADNDNDIDNEKNIKIALTVDWDRFLDKFNSITGKKAKVVNDKCKRQVRARLSEGYTKADFIEAITNCSKDKYHIETGLKYLTLEFITRADKMEMFTTIKKPEAQKSKNQIGRI
jgi:uncharacterized phage protein (TIGR02220 family)